MPDDLVTCSGGLSALLGRSAGQAWGDRWGLTPLPRSHASPEATGALPIPQNPKYRAPAREASVFPAPVARGVREQPPDAPRLWEGKGQGLGGSAERRVGGCSPGPVSRNRPQRVAGGGERGELSAQHRRPPHPPPRAAPEPCGPRQRGHPPVPQPLPPGRPSSRPPEQPQSRRGLGNELTQLQSRQQEPRTPTLVFPEAAKLWARPTGSQPPHASLRGLGR